MEIFFFIYLPKIGYSQVLLYQKHHELLLVQIFEIIRNGDNASFTMTTPRGLYLSKLEEKIDFAAKIPIS